MSITKIQRLGIGGILCSFLVIVALAYDYSQDAIATGEVNTNVFAPIQSELHRANHLLSDSGNAFLRFIHRDRIAHEDISEAFGRLVRLEQDLITQMPGQADLPTLRDRPARKAHAAFDGFIEEEVHDPADDTVVQLKAIVLERIGRMRIAAREVDQIAQTEPRLRTHIESYSNLTLSAESLFGRYIRRDRITLNAAIQPAEQALRILDQIPVDVFDKHKHRQDENGVLASTSEISAIEDIRKALIRYRSSLYSLFDSEDSRATGTAFIESRDAAELALYDSQQRLAVGTNILGQRLRALQQKTLSAGRSNQRIFLLLAGVTLCLALAFSIWMGSAIATRIRSLVDAVKKIAVGELDLRVEEQGTDSFARLAIEFNHMAQELRAKDDSLVERITQLDEVRGHLHKVNDELEKRVADRTAELQWSEDRFKQFAAASADWLWEQDENLRFTYLSNEVQPKSGLAVAAHIGKTRQEVVHRGVTDEQWQQHQADLDARRPFRDFTFERMDEAGQIQHVSVSGVPIFDKNGRFCGYRGTATNITERKRIETELVAAKQAADSASQAKTVFLANMSHELRTPLNAIIGYAELLEEEAGERGDERLGTDLTKVRNAGKHLLGLINNVLDLSKVEAGKMELNFEETELDGLLAEIADSVEPIILKNRNTFEVAKSAAVTKIITDALKLRQSLLNLLGNAAKFTKDGTVRLDISEEPAGRINFVVSDTGVGMDVDQLENVLDPFTQGNTEVSRKYGGTGLGLAITKNFAELLGGRLEVESELGQGSRFTLSLPLHSAEAARAVRA